MKLVFISGPFRADSAWGVEQNIRRAEELSLEVWRKGFACICPHTNTRFFDGAADDNIWLAGDIEIMRRCDAVLLVPGWENSSGSVAEVKIARYFGIPVFESIDDLGGLNSGEIVSGIH